MLRKSLLLLTTTAILLPLQAAEARFADDRKERVISERSDARATRRAARTERARSGQNRQRTEARSRRTQSQARAPRNERSQRAQQPQRTQRVERSAPRNQQVSQPQVRRSSNERTQARTQPRRQRTEDRRVRQQVARETTNDRQLQVAQPQQRQTTRDRGRVRDTVSASRQRARETQRSRTRATNNAVRRDVVRERTRGATRYNRDDAARYAGARSRSDARYDRVERTRNRSEPRSYDGHRRADPYQPHVRRNFRRSVYNNYFFGYGSFFGGSGFGLGLSYGYDPFGPFSPFSPFYSPVFQPYNQLSYFGHWPHARGFYGRRAFWGWNHIHSHYHYDDYCPGFDRAHNGYYGYNNFAYSNHGHSDGDNVAGTLLGAVVGGIIGAEIDGGYNRTAGALAGAVVGATIGNAATSDRDHEYRGDGTAEYRPYSSSDRFDSNGRHVYEREAYQPPEEIRTCMKYGYRRGDYVCTKWTVEYAYDDSAGQQ